MVIGFFVLSCLISIGLLIGTFVIGKYDNSVRRYIQHLFIAAIITIMCNAVAVVSPWETVATLFHGLYFAATDWLVIVLLRYARNYTNARDGKLFVKILLYIGAVADTVSMAVNTYTHHVFSSQSMTLFGWECYGIVKKVHDTGIYVYGLHIGFVYSLVLLVMLTFIIRTAQTIKLYRRKYLAVIWSFILVLSINIGYRFINIPIDISPIAYSALAICSAYFTLFYVPKSIVAKLLSLSVEDMENAIFCLDKDGKCVYANDKSRYIFDAYDDVAPLEEYFANWREGKGIEEFKEDTWKEERMLDGENHHFEVHFRYLMDNRGNYVGCFFALTDRTEEYVEREIEHYKATHDYLTDIYNRERFFKAVEELLKREPDTKRVIVCLDVKDFKMVNDLFGEETGNRVLKRIAGLMRRDASEDTLYARLESDRFAMCMREERFIEDNYWVYLDDLKRIVNSSVYRMHVHVGVYKIIDPTLSISVMCDRAFVAIKNIKDSYQQIVSYYTDDMGRAVQREKVLVGEFDRAISNGEFHMYLQPQVAVDGYHILGAEALVRWEHPVRGMISPAEFIPVFEKSGNITRLDRYMWTMACKQLKIWKDNGREDLHISVNISPRDFYAIDIYETFTSLVERYGISPVNLKLEITETALMEEISKQMNLIVKLREYGFHVEIDDFGSGYSSLNTLQDIVVDVLKLDMGFLRKTSHEGRSRTIMNAVIDMSKKLGLTVVTEGVETEEQVNYLTEAGCDIFQGYYFSKPMPIRDFENKYNLDKKVNMS